MHVCLRMHVRMYVRACVHVCVSLAHDTAVTHLRLLLHEEKRLFSSGPGGLRSMLGAVRAGMTH